MWRPQTREIHPGVTTTYEFESHSGIKTVTCLSDVTGEPQTPTSSNMPRPSHCSRSSSQPPPADDHRLISSVPPHRPPYHTVRTRQADAPPTVPPIRDLLLDPSCVGQRPQQRADSSNVPAAGDIVVLCEEKGEGVDVREWRLGQGRRRPLLLEADVAFVLWGGQSRLPMSSPCRETTALLLVLQMRARWCC